jgi:hypothetical protein
VWTLSSIEFKSEIVLWGSYTVYPVWRNNIPEGYVFLQANFECTTNQSLVSLMTEEDLGLTIVRKPAGYPDIFLQDENGQNYPVTIVGSCWLAAPVPGMGHEYSLHFKDFLPIALN